MSDSVHLHLGLHLADTWREVAGPWLVRATRAALGSELPWVVLTPSRAYAQALKALLLADQRSVGGIHFWTPGDLRRALRLHMSFQARIGIREHLHVLLASVAAEQEEASAQAVARDPARLLRSLDQVHAGGHPVTELGFAPAEKVAAAYAKALEHTHLTTVQQFDWALARKPPAGVLGGLLVLGFDAAHWELWPLLQGAVRSAVEAEVVLTRPRSKAEDLDQAWVSSWEEEFGEAEPMAETEEPSRFAALAQQMENPEGSASGVTPPISILIGRHLREQASAVVAQCAAWLAEGTVSRLGILLPGPGPLAREISSQLKARGLLHYDSLGHPAPPSLTARRWRAWIQLQRTYRLGPLKQVLELSPELSLPEGWERQAERALGDMLVDDLPVLSERLYHLKHAETATLLSGLESLSAEDTLHQLLQETKAHWTRLKWDDALAALKLQESAVESMREYDLTASLFLDWLEAVTPSPAQVRDPESTNPLALVHLVTYPQAEGLAWSHVIMTDLNEGQWPPSFDTISYLHERQITALNHGVLATGRQGEGHTVVQPGHALMLGPNERRALCRRQFYNLVESARRGLALTCVLESEEGKGRILPASDLLSHLYFSAFREPLSEAAMQARHAATADWLDALPAAPREPPPAQPAPMHQVRIAYDERRRDAPFGIYACAFAQPPAQAISLSCKEWQDALVDPASVWMKHYLGVAPARDENGDRWPMTRGSWVHAWLARGLCRSSNTFVPRAHGAAIAEAVERVAGQTREVLSLPFQTNQRAVPEWWRARWAEAEWLALHFARRLAELNDWPWAATEWKLPQPCEVKLIGPALRLRGRLDLLLSQREPEGVPEAGWLADFKTGSDKKLSARSFQKQFLRGEGVQLALYALALEAAGCREVHISLLNADSEVAPQIGLPEVHEALSIWEALAVMQESGIFGMRGKVRNEFGRSVTLPLAHLEVDQDLWERQWQLTHPYLAEADEGAHE